MYIVVLEEGGLTLISRYVRPRQLHQQLYWKVQNKHKEYRYHIYFTSHKPIVRSRILCTLASRFRQKTPPHSRLLESLQASNGNIHENYKHYLCTHRRWWGTEWMWGSGGGGVFLGIRWRSEASSNRKTNKTQTNSGVANLWAGTDTSITMGGYIIYHACDAKKYRLRVNENRIVRIVHNNIYRADDMLCPKNVQPYFGL